MSAVDPKSCRHVVLNLTLIFVGTLVAITVGELLCRFLRPLSTVEYHMDADVGPILAPGETSRWVNEDYDVVVTTNSTGFHDVEHVPEKAQDLCRVVVLGDSYTEGLASFPLERWFASIGLLAPAGRIGSALDRADVPLGWSVYLSHPSEKWISTERLTLRMVREAKSLAERNGASFLVMMIGSVSAVEARWKEALARYPGADALKRDLERPFTILQEAGREGRFGVVNLTDPFRSDFQTTGRSSAWPHDGHWNARGHQLAAEVLGAYLLDHRQEYRLN